MSMIELELDHYGGRHERQFDPTLQDLLECKDPFWIFQTNNSIRNHRLGLVYAQLYKCYDHIMHGIHLIDRDNKITFVAERNSKKFKQYDRIIVPFNNDKFYYQGCRYELKHGNLNSLIAEFQDCGYTFPGQHELKHSVA